ncbi:MAG: 16S rRNA (cytosine(1402)-N(4))-methyltransferase, partial [bacterium]|nr:16S rRNA (cytosine(1402)-N(4))-methyltransferase [bacterium]
QALRIAVNREFENIERGLAAAAEVLSPGGRIVAISFHYREDALIKHFFRQPALRGIFTPLVERPLTPSRAEIAGNPRSRSALLRAYEKVS